MNKIRKEKKRDTEADEAQIEAMLREEGIKSLHLQKIIQSKAWLAKAPKETQQNLEKLEKYKEERMIKELQKLEDDRRLRGENLKLAKEKELRRQAHMKELKTIVQQYKTAKEEKVVKEKENHLAEEKKKEVNAHRLKIRQDENQEKIKNYQMWKQQNDLEKAGEERVRKVSVWGITALKEKGKKGKLDEAILIPIVSKHMVEARQDIRHDVLTRMYGART